MKYYHIESCFKMYNDYFLKDFLNSFEIIIELTPVLYLSSAIKLPSGSNITKQKYRLAINNPAINIPVPSVFRHEFRSAVSNFPSWFTTVFESSPFVLMVLYPESVVCSHFLEQTHSFSFICIIIIICCCITPSWIQLLRV